MHGRKKWWNDKRIYPRYEPYPVSWDLEQPSYSSGTHSEESRRKNRPGQNTEDFSLIGDPTPSGDWISSSSSGFDDDRTLRPLRLLNSLFTDRLNLLQRALEGLEVAKQDRSALTTDALEDLDIDIAECERNLTTLQGLAYDPERRHQVERKLFDLKRERRRERLLSWRDLVWLKGEIRKLQHQIEALGRTARPTENQEAPK